MSSQQLSLTYLPVSKRRPDPQNARQHSARQLKQIARSIESFGFNVPILVDADLKVIAGHGRLAGWPPAGSLISKQCRPSSWSISARRKPVPL